MGIFHPSSYSSIYKRILSFLQEDQENKKKVRAAAADHHYRGYPSLRQILFRPRFLCRSSVRLCLTLVIILLMMILFSHIPSSCLSVPSVGSFTLFFFFFSGDISIIRSSLLSQIHFINPLSRDRRFCLTNNNKLQVDKRDYSLCTWIMMMMLILRF